VSASASAGGSSNCAAIDDAKFSRAGLIDAIGSGQFGTDGKEEDDSNGEAEK